MVSFYCKSLVLLKRNRGSSFSGLFLHKTDGDGDDDPVGHTGESGNSICKGKLGEGGIQNHSQIQ